MKRPNIKVGDLVRLIDIEDPELPLVTLEVTRINVAEEVYGSTIEDTYIGLTLGRGEKAGGREVGFVKDQVVAINTDHRAALYSCQRLLESNLRQTCTKLSLTEQMLLLGVIKAYAR